MECFSKFLLLFIILTNFSFSSDHQTIPKKPRVAIITSIYKGDDYMELFLSNIVKQTIFDECELILINAASPGNEEPIIKPYLEKYPNISYERLEKDPGIYGVWNLGIKKAKAEYITNANIDDQRNPICLETHAKALDEDPTVDLVYSDFWITNKPYETYENHSATLYNNIAEFSPQLMNLCLGGPAPMWRKSLHSKAGYFSEQFYSSGDLEMWNRAVSKGSKFKKVPGVYCLYYLNPQGLSTKPDSKRFEEDKFVYGAYSYMWNHLENQPPKLLIQISSRSNPGGLFHALNQYYRNFSGTVAYHFLVTLDENDLVMNTPSMREKLEAYPNLSYYFGPWNSPIHAKNRDIEKHPNFDILLLGRDDTIEITAFFDRLIADIMQKSFSAYDGVLTVKNDTETKHSIIPIIGKKYYERFGFVYYPGYQSEYHDEDLKSVAKLLHKFRETTAVSVTTSPSKEHNIFQDEDRELFNQRRETNYHIKPEWIQEAVVPAYRIPLHG
jgi:hypothetical protein